MDVVGRRVGIGVVKISASPHHHNHLRVFVVDGVVDVRGVLALDFVSLPWVLGAVILSFVSLGCSATRGCE